jgi:light-independent protochlorophyllide reductase subunit B
MGLEEHLLHMFRDDFEFHDSAGPSHLAGHAPAPSQAAAPAAETAQPASAEAAGPLWSEAAEQELRKVPFFVRGKARRNTERFAAERSLPIIEVETLYDAKAHFAR